LPGSKNSLRERNVEYEVGLAATFYTGSEVSPFSSFWIEPIGIFSLQEFINNIF